MKIIAIIKDIWWLLLFFLYVLSLLIFSNTNVHSPLVKKSRDWEDIMQEDTLRVIFFHHPSDMFVFRGAPMGFCYELIMNFARDHKLFVKAVFADNDLSGLRKLVFEEWDILAIPYPTNASTFPNTVYSDTIFEDNFVVWCESSHVSSRNYINSFTCCVTPYMWKGIYKLFEHYTTYCTCKIPLPLNLIKNSRFCKDSALNFIVFAPRKWFSFLHGMKRMNLKSVSEKRIPLAWITRETSSNLNKKIHLWFQRVKERKITDILFTKYYAQNTFAGIYHSFYSSQLSPYDAIIKKHAYRLGWDWQLLASLIYEESHFLDTLSSPSGAYGIMQLMPFVLEKYGLDSTSKVEEHILAGSLHLQELQQIFLNDSIEPNDLLKITVASYNLGFYPIKQAIAKLYEQKHQRVTYAEIMHYLAQPSSTIQVSPKALRQAKQFVHNIFERYLIYKALYP